MEPATEAETQPYKIRIEYLYGDQIQYSYDTTQIDSINPHSSVKKSVEFSHSSDSVNSNISVDVKCNLSNEKRIHKKLNLTCEQKKTQRSSLLLLLKELLFAVQKEQRTEQLKFQRCPLLLSVLNCIRSLEIYANSLIELKMSGTLKRNKAAVGTASTTTGAVGEEVSRKVLRQNDDFAELTTSEKDGSASNSLQNRRPPKNLRTPDNVRLMLVPESPEETNEKDSSKSFIYLHVNKPIYISFFFRS